MATNISLATFGILAGATASSVIPNSFRESGDEAVVLLYNNTTGLPSRAVDYDVVESMPLSIPINFESTNNAMDLDDYEEYFSNVNVNFSDMETDLPDVDGWYDNAEYVAEPDDDEMPSNSHVSDGRMDEMEMQVNEDDANVDGIVESGGEIGAEDGEPFGPTDLAEMDNGQAFIDTLFDFTTPDLPDENETPTVDIGNMEKIDASGDIGTDTAVRSSAAAALTSGLSPYLHSNMVSSAQRGAAPAPDIKTMDMDKAVQLFNTIKRAVDTDAKKRITTYKALKSIESELMGVDNIVYVKDTILTPQELKNKLSSRIHRIMGLQKKIMSTALAMNDRNTVFYHSAVAIDNMCDNCLVVLDKLNEHPEKKSLLDYLKAFVSSALAYLSHITSTIKESLDNNDRSHIEHLAILFDSWDNARHNEESVSKILKLDPNNNSHDSAYTKKMRQNMNSTVLQTLQLLRKTNIQLNAKAIESYASVNAKVNDRKLKYKSKQASETISRNTNNILQQYPTVPVGAKVNARRLNALETPLAVKNGASIYVKNYEQTKRFFVK